MDPEKLQQEIIFYENKAKECYNLALKTQNLNLRYKLFNIGKYCTNISTNFSKLYSAIKEKNNVRHGY